MLKTSKNCVESAASYLGRVVVAKKNIRKTLNKYFSSIQKTTIRPYTQTKFSRNATVMSAAIKRKSTITRAAFKNWTEHSVQHCHICDRIQLFQTGILGTRKFGSKKKSKGRPKAETKDSFWSQSFFDFLALQIKSIIPATVTFQEVNNKDLNPHVSLCICEICSELKIQ